MQDCDKVSERAEQTKLKLNFLGGCVFFNFVVTEAEKVSTGTE